MENVITLGKLIGLLLFCPPSSSLFCFLKIDTIRKHIFSCSIGLLQLYSEDIVQQLKWVTRLRSIKFFSLLIISLWDICNNIQVGVEFLPLRN